MDFAIETINLSKSFGPIHAVNDVNLRVKRGEIYAFLGLNGAGKTTTIRMLLGMIKPTAGVVHLLGTKVRRGGKNPWQSVGYLVETTTAYPELSVCENLEAARRLRPGVKQTAVTQIIDLLRLTPYADRRAGALSQGNAQRLGLAKAFIHRPQLLILDEPTNGLDPAGIVEIRDLLLRLARERGVTIFMSSHILAEVSRLAHRIGIIHQGKLVQELSAADLEKHRRRWLAVRVRNPAAGRAVLTQAGFSVEQSPDHTLILREQTALDAPDEIAARLVQADCAPLRLAVEREALEPYFLRLVGVKGDE